FANLALYEGRSRDAAQTLEQGAASDLAAKKPDAAADKFAILSYAQLLRGDKKSASSAAQKSLASSQSVKIRFLAGRSFVEAGDSANARKMAASLTSELGTEPRAYAKLLLGEAALKDGKAKDAVQLFSESDD